MTRILKSRETLLAAAILALIALISLRFPAFATPSNLAGVFNDTAILIVLALGQMTVILTKCIDLSVAATLALTGMVVAMLNHAHPGIPVAALLALAGLLGAALGSVNGLLVWKLDIPPIVVTLGTLTIYRGIIFLISGGAWINDHEMSPAFKALPRAVVAGLPVLSWVAVAAIALVWLLTTRSGLGRAFYAVGGNPRAAVYTGIDVGRTRFAAFVLSGTLAGLLRLPLGRPLRRRLRRHRRRLRARRGRGLRDRRHLHRRRHRLGGGRGDGRAVPRRDQERAAGDQHLAVLAAGDLRHRHHRRRRRQRPRRAAARAGSS